MAGRPRRARHRDRRERDDAAARARARRRRRALSDRRPRGTAAARPTRRSTSCCRRSRCTTSRTGWCRCASSHACCARAAGSCCRRTIRCSPSMTCPTTSRSRSSTTRGAGSPPSSCPVRFYHRPLEKIVADVLAAGFALRALHEPRPVPGGGVAQSRARRALSHAPGLSDRRGGSARAMSYGDKAFEAFRVGDRATFAKTIGEAEILLFAAVSGDNYPLHVDAEYAKTTRFGQRAAHGMLSASLLSTVVGLLLQKPGGIYVEQSIRFQAPGVLGDTLTAQRRGDRDDPASDGACASAPRDRTSAARPCRRRRPDPEGRGLEQRRVFGDRLEGARVVEVRAVHLAASPASNACARASNGTERREALRRRSPCSQASMRRVVEDRRHAVVDRGAAARSASHGDDRARFDARIARTPALP